ncbi:conserved hypothetical protein [Klebsiella pneumoniae]|nr:hypothetical protein SB4536_1570006 [Klebsiella pneumoniae subsp. pneumoniae T69]SAL89577.1 conserved hypothetical protein [Klebsiella pneumoniae]
MSRVLKNSQAGCNKCLRQGNATFFCDTPVPLLVSLGDHTYAS